MSRSFILAAALLAACATPAPNPADDVQIVWNRVDDVQAVCQNLAGRKEIYAIRGCSKWNESSRSDQRVCSIYVPTPKNETDKETFATLGHELMHCFDGDWHDKWGRMNDNERQAATGAARKPEGGAAAN